MGRVSFVGDHLIDLDRYRDPSFSGLEGIFSNLPFPSFGPWIMVAVTVALLTLPLVARQSTLTSGSWWNTAVIAGCYWGPILFVALFFGESHDRYLLHVQAVGLLMVAGLVGWLVPVDFWSVKLPGSTRFRERG